MEFPIFPDDLAFIVEEMTPEVLAATLGADDGDPYTCFECGEAMDDDGCPYCAPPE